MAVPARLHTIDALRTAAALSVVLYHFLLFEDGGKLFPALGENDLFFELLRTVVLTFFIITGIVIPLHYEQNNYRLKNYPVFFLKRLLRVHIPFTVLIALLIGWSYFRSVKNGTAFVFDSKQFWANFTYTASFQNVPWYNTIFWTLAIEMQFYIIAGFLYPLIRKFGFAAIAGYFLSGELLFVTVPDLRTVWAFTPWFALGFLIYELYRGNISRKTFLFSWPVIALSVGAFHDIYAVPVTAAVSLICTFTSGRRSFLSKLGKYTFSYYLVHGLAGGTFLYFSRSWGTELPVSAARVVMALLISFAAAFVFYRLVEKPAIRLMHRIRYERQ